MGERSIISPFQNSLTCVLSFNMAHSFLENIDDVDIISDAEVTMNSWKAIAT